MVTFFIASAIIEFNIIQLQKVAKNNFLNLSLSVRASMPGTLSVWVDLSHRFPWITVSCRFTFLHLKCFYIVVTAYIYTVTQKVDSLTVIYISFISWQSSLPDGLLAICYFNLSSSIDNLVSFLMDLCDILSSSMI